MVSQRLCDWRTLYFLVFSACQIQIQCMNPITSTSTEASVERSHFPEAGINHIRDAPLSHRPWVDGSSHSQGTLAVPSAFSTQMEPHPASLLTPSTGNPNFIIAPNPSAHRIKTHALPPPEGTILYMTPGIVFRSPEWNPRHMVPTAQVGDLRHRVYPISSNGIRAEWPSPRCGMGSTLNSAAAAFVPEGNTVSTGTATRQPRPSVSGGSLNPHAPEFTPNLPPGASNVKAETAQHVPPMDKSRTSGLAVDVDSNRNAGTSYREDGVPQSSRPVNGEYPKALETKHIDNEGTSSLDTKTHNLGPLLTEIPPTRPARGSKPTGVARAKTTTVAEKNLNDLATGIKARESITLPMESEKAQLFPAGNSVETGAMEKALIPVAHSGQPNDLNKELGALSKNSPETTQVAPPSHQPSILKSERQSIPTEKKVSALTQQELEERTRVLCEALNIHPHDSKVTKTEMAVGDANGSSSEGAAKPPLYLADVPVHEMSQTNAGSGYDQEFPSLSAISRTHTIQTSRESPKDLFQKANNVPKASQKLRKAQHNSSAVAQLGSKLDKKAKDLEQSAGTRSFQNYLDNKPESIKAKTRNLAHKNTAEISTPSITPREARLKKNGGKIGIPLTPSKSISKSDQTGISIPDSAKLRSHESSSSIAPLSTKDPVEEKAADGKLNTETNSTHQKDSVAGEPELAHATPESKSESGSRESDVRVAAQVVHKAPGTNKELDSLGSTRDGRQDVENFDKTPEKVVQVKNPLNKNPRRRTKMAKTLAEDHATFGKNVLAVMPPPVHRKPIEPRYGVDTPPPREPSINTPLEINPDGPENEAIVSQEVENPFTSKGKDKLSAKLIASDQSESVFDADLKSQEDLRIYPTGRNIGLDQGIEQKHPVRSKTELTQTSQENHPSYPAVSTYQLRNKKLHPVNEKWESFIHRKFHDTNHFQDNRISSKKWNPWFSPRERELVFAHTCNAFGHQNALTLVQKKVDLYIANTLAIQLTPLNLSFHYGLGPEIDFGVINILLAFWKKQVKAYQTAQEAIEEIIGLHEGKRRVTALQILLMNSSAANQWNLQMDGLLAIQTRMATLDAFMAHYGVSYYPSEFKNIPVPKWTDGPPPPDSNIYLRNAMGLFRASRRMKLVSYLEDRSNRKRWWEPFNLEDASARFGLDVLTIIKIGDALNFGYDDRNWIGKSAYSPGTSDSSYAQLLSIFLNENRDILRLPWIESSERAWLIHVFPGNLYQKRLDALSFTVWRWGTGNRIQFPLSTNILSKYLEGHFVNRVDHRLGYELYWCDNGHDLEESLMKMKARKSQALGLSQDEQEMGSEEGHNLPDWIQNPPVIHNEPDISYFLRNVVKMIANVPPFRILSYFL
ncbi:hypothetical protein MJO29_010433 [Puccinia striiformis f. sp. tritici]|nr:hypothetical protein MJO29_010433 [Puccinia striiformis f. sp. tritici]